MITGCNATNSYHRLVFRKLQQIFGCTSYVVINYLQTARAFNDKSVSQANILRTLTSISISAMTSHLVLILVFWLILCSSTSVILPFPISCRSLCDELVCLFAIIAFHWTDHYYVMVSSYARFHKKNSSCVL